MPLEERKEGEEFVPWVPRVYLHEPYAKEPKKQANCVPLASEQTIEALRVNAQEKGDPQSCQFMIMHVLGCKTGYACFTSIGAENDENMMAFNMRTERVCKRTRYLDRPEPGGYSMVDPDLVSILQVETPFEDEKYKLQDG